VSLNSTVNIGPLTVTRGTYSYGWLNLATSGIGADHRLPLHVFAGRQAGPRLVVLACAHGYEIIQISVLRALAAEIDPGALRGDLVLVPVVNPTAFAMGTRSTWIDGLWGDTGNANRLWPGRANGWFTERVLNTLATDVIGGATAVIDLHSCTPSLDLAYGYLGPGGPGSLDYEISRAFGHELLVEPTPDELVAKRQTSGTSKVFVRSLGIAAYSCEIGEFFGLERERAARPAAELHRGVPEVGVTGIKNVMCLLEMIEGELRRPSIQLRVRPELNLRPTHGGLLVSEFGKEAIGTVIPKGTVLGTVISPYSLEVVEEIVAPFEQNVVLATLARKPFAKVLPGEFAFIVADDEETQVLP
jgi:uncharacterized protein